MTSVLVKISQRENSVSEIPQHYLEPSKLTIGNLLKEIFYSLKLFRLSKLSPSDSIIFLGLRILQFISYNLGWKDGFHNGGY
jgi:hypothetical protein